MPPADEAQPASPTPPPISLTPAPAPAPAQRRPMRPGLHLTFLVTTLYTMTLAGALSTASGAERIAREGTILLADARFLSLGLPYSLCLLAILGVHEMGHYVACRRYGVDATLPFFLPGFPLPIGTFGAFIRIREPIPDRRALFDIGVAGPLAGFVVAVPVLIVGTMVAEVVPESGQGAHVGVPLLIGWLLSWLSSVPEGQTVSLSGPLMAGWVGCLATAVNLFPIGQLDGGHMCYAISPRFHRRASQAMMAAFVALGLFLYPGWLFLATLLVLFGSRHPPLTDPGGALSRGRLVVAALALIILILCFIPQPFDLSEL